MSDLVLDPCKRRQDITGALRKDPYSLTLYLERARVHQQLKYPDLAVADAYKALLLADELVDEYGEYHEQAYTSASLAVSNDIGRRKLLTILSLEGDSADAFLHAFAGEVALATELNDHGSTDVCTEVVKRFVIPHTSIFLAHCLASVNCLRNAYDYIRSVEKYNPNIPAVKLERERILSLAEADAKQRGSSRDHDNFLSEDLPDSGLVRREAYVWNNHEQDRMSPASLDILNEELQSVGPKLEVKATNLPILERGAFEQEVSTQLGVFAKADIEPGELVLRERSLLTANARLHEPLCDACSAVLPDQTHMARTFSDQSAATPCSDCDEVFCSQRCYDLALESYHTVLCGAEVDSIAKDVPSSQAVDALYTQLLFRALALAYAQGKHPLELKEVKYIWGDFVTLGGSSSVHSDEPDVQHYSTTLPYNFRSQVLQPIHFLELLDINIFEAPHDMAETWVYNILLAKFRGTASARISPGDGRPEVAAVHPLWCLANHSCDPNVQWEWGGEITFAARQRRAEWTRNGADRNETERLPAAQGGIKKGDEILNHYVDIDLDVTQRREWGVGALGGHCKCPRCLWESGDDDIKRHQSST